MPIRRALLSVSNKDGLVEFARALHQRGIAILSTGGDRQRCSSSTENSRHAGVGCTRASGNHGRPREDAASEDSWRHCSAGRDIDDAVMKTHGIEPIDLVVVNLYPFAATVAKPGCTYEDAIENIDIGGPAMVRAAREEPRSRDGHRRSVRLRERARGAGGERRRRVALERRKKLAAKAYAHTASYDSAVASYFGPRHRKRVGGIS